MTMAAIHHISSDFDPISAATLPPVQAQVVAALLPPSKLSRPAALEAQIHRTTIHHWMRTEPDFQGGRRNRPNRECGSRVARRNACPQRPRPRDPAQPSRRPVRPALGPPEGRPPMSSGAPNLPDQGWNLPGPIRPRRHNRKRRRGRPMQEPPTTGTITVAPPPLRSGLKYKRRAPAEARSQAYSTYSLTTHNPPFPPT